MFACDHIILQGIHINHEVLLIGNLGIFHFVLNPHSSGYNYYLGDVLFRIERYKEAIDIFKKASELSTREEDPEYLLAYFQWGIALQKLERYHEAIEKYQKVMK